MRRATLFALGMWIVFAAAPAVRAEMVYLHQAGEFRRVALAEDDGTLIRFLTPRDSQAYHPELSADGRYVAYSIGTIRPDHVDVAIHVQDLQTGDVEVWTPSGDQYIHAEFSGDGDYLAYSGPVAKPDAGTRQAIHLVHLPTARAQGPVRTEVRDGRTYRYFEPRTEIIAEEAQAFFPALASDGSFVIYHRTKDLGSHETAKELVLFDRREGTAKLLTDEGGHAMVPSLSWDDHHLAYAAVADGQWDLHVMDLRSGDSRALTDTPAKEFTPIFAPDGSITYTHIESASEGRPPGLDLYRIPREQVFRAEAKPNPQPVVADPAVSEYVPAFSGDETLTLDELPQLPDPARSSFGATEHGGRIYVAGGHQGPEHTYPPESFLDRLDIYDTATKTWTRGASMSVPRHGFEIVAHGGYLYAFGGFAHSAKHRPGWRSLDIVERYDIAADRWEVLPQRLPRPRSSNVAVTLGGKVYLIGGWDSTPQSVGDKEGRFHAEIDVFDLETETTATSPHRLPTPLRRAFTAVDHDGEIILLGGITQGRSHFDWLDKVTAFRPADGRWRELPALPFPTFAPGAGVHDGRLFLFGGMAPGGAYRNTIHALDLDRPAAWANTGRYLAENKGFPIVVGHPDGGLAILGGHTYRAEPDGIVDTPVATVEHLK